MIEYFFSNSRHDIIMLHHNYIESVFGFQVLSAPQDSTATQRVITKTKKVQHIITPNVHAWIIELVMQAAWYDYPFQISYSRSSCLTVHPNAPNNPFCFNSSTLIKFRFFANIESRHESTIDYFILFSIPIQLVFFQFQFQLFQFSVTVIIISIIFNSYFNSQFQ